jgi:hypothetical protein
MRSCAFLEFCVDEWRDPDHHKPGSQTRQIRVVAPLPIWATVGSTTATANSDSLVPANVPEYFQVTPGQVFSFISTSTSSGYVSFAEMS